MDEIIKIVTDVTSVTAEEIIAKRGNVDTQEARMIFILIAKDHGYSDYEISYYLHRTQVSIWKTRKYAEEYGKYSTAFLVKYQHAQAKCEAGKRQIN